MVSCDRARELFEYHSDGYLVHKVDRGRTAKAGQRCGRGNPKHYRQVRVDNKMYREHVIIWLVVKGEWPNVIDHIDHNMHNNKIENLRSVTHKQNIRHGSGRQAGLFYSDLSKKWEAGIYVDSIKKHLGCFVTYEEALAARLKAQEEYWA